MKCILPCAGYATRLYPLTEAQPKPLLKIAGKPMIEYVIDKVLEVKGIDAMYIVTNNKFYGNFKEWAEAYALHLDAMNVKLKILNDGTLSNDDRLGAIGDISFVIEKENLDDDILVVLGDNLFEFSLKEMHQKFRHIGHTVIALYDVKKIEEARRFGIVLADENMRIVDFEEKPAKPKSTLASIGIYFYPREIIKLLPGYLAEGNSKDAPGKFPEWLHKRKPVHGHVYDSAAHRWFDVGSHESLREADEYHKRKQL